MLTLNFNKMQLIFLPSIIFLIIFTSACTTTEEPIEEIEEPLEEIVEEVEEEEEEIEELEELEVTDKVFEDEFLSFEYSSNFQLLVTEGHEGLYTKNIKFLVWDESKDSFRESGLSMTFPYGLGATGEFYTFTELVDFYDNGIGAGLVTEVKHPTEDGREGIAIQASGLGAYSYLDVYFPMEDVNEYLVADEYAYYFSRHGMTEYPDETNALLEQIIDSLTFRR